MFVSRSLVLALSLPLGDLSLSFFLPFFSRPLSLSFSLPFLFKTSLSLPNFLLETFLSLSPSLSLSIRHNCLTIYISISSNHLSLFSWMMFGGCIDKNVASWIFLRIDGDSGDTVGPIPKRRESIWPPWTRFLINRTKLRQPTSPNQVKKSPSLIYCNLDYEP